MKIIKKGEIPSKAREQMCGECRTVVSMTPDEGRYISPDPRDPGDNGSIEWKCPVCEARNYAVAWR